MEVEEYLVRQDLPYTVFQPLYIYGPHTAKDCEQCELDGLHRMIAPRLCCGGQACISR